MTFEELGLSDPLLRAIADAGYTTPTPIQAQAIPHLLMGRDIIGIAQTGTGKTASFTLPMIEALSSGRARARMPRSLILEPTRELAAQVAENFEVYGKHHKLSMALLIGGVSFSDQEDKLDRGVDVLIATPGRLLDHFERGKVLLADIRILVCDEADRMLDMGFIPDVERIIKLLPAIRQTAMFSATMPAEIKRLTNAYMMNPRTVQVAPQASAAETVKQGLTMVRGDFKEKSAALRDLIRAEKVRNAIVFCNRKRDISTLERSLKQHGFNAAGLHGDMHQTARTQTLEKFREGEITILVASDVAARGLDIVDMSHVFNFDVPMHADDYIHRIGRTGRAGKEGRALTIATRADTKYIDAIERMLGMPIPRLGDAGDADEAADADEGAEEKPARRSRSARGERRGRGRRRDGDAATATADETDADTAEAEAAESGSESPSRPDADEGTEERPARRSRSRRGERRGRGRDADAGSADTGSAEAGETQADAAEAGSEPPSRPDAEDGADERPARRSRSGRGERRGRGRGRSRNEDTASEKADEARDDTADDEDEAPQTERGGRTHADRARSGRTRTERPRPEPAPAESSRGGERRGSRKPNADDRDDRVQGMGDHMPDFLRR